MKVDFSKGFYYEKDYYWQCVFIPTFTLLVRTHSENYRIYKCLTLEWLFWNCSLTFNYD